MRQGRPTLLINGQAQAPLLYALSDCPGARWSWEEVPARNIALFGSQGVRLFQVDLWFEQMIGEDDQLDIALAQRQIAGVLAACPEAAVMLRLHVNAPPWWCARHPEECVGYADTEAHEGEPWGLRRPLATDGEKPIRASFSSSEWRTWAGRHLRDFCARLSDVREGGAVFAIQVANGLYGEWHQFGFLHHDPDTGGAATRAFRAWLERRHGSEEALAAAWGRPGMRWTDVLPPDSPEREAASLAVLRDPRTQRNVIEYFEFQHEALTDALLGLVAVVKQTWPRPVVTAAFFGYFFCLFGRTAAGAHLALERALASPDLDCLCAPQSYSVAAREFGGSGHARGLASVVRRAGKLWLDEMDQATSVCGCPWDRKFCSTLDDDVAVMRRNVLHPVLRGGGMWWYDFGPMAGAPSFAMRGLVGWWDEPRLQVEVAALHRLVQARVDLPYSRPADVLVVHDPRSFFHTISRKHPVNSFEFGAAPPVGPDPISPRAVDGLAEALHRSGLIHDEALLSELPQLDLGPYRLVLFATTPVLAPDLRRFIQERVAGEGRHVALLGYAGWGDGGRIGPELAGALSGIETRVAEVADPASVLELDGASERQVLNQPLAVPVYLAAEENVIGHWESGGVSASWKADREATWWTFAVAPSCPGILRALGRRAGCLVVNDRDEPTLLGDGLLVIHSVEGGPRELHLPGGKTVTTVLPLRSTTVLSAETGATLLS